MMIFCGAIRVYSNAALTSKKWWPVDKYLLQVFSVSFLYSTLLTMVLMFFMRPVILGMGLVLHQDRYTAFVVVLYLIFCLLALFGIEWKNNSICLKGFYKDKLIFQATLVSHVISFILLMAYVMI